MTLMTKREAMLELRLKDERTLLRLVKTGLLPCRMHGNRMMFTEEDIGDYLLRIRRVGRKDVPQQSQKNLRKTVADFKDALLAVLSALEGISSSAPNQP
jgi:predicted site-specific integrase-resolvase